MFYRHCSVVLYSVFHKTVNCLIDLRSNVLCFANEELPLYIEGQIGCTQQGTELIVNGHIQCVSKVRTFSRSSWIILLFDFRQRFSDSQMSQCFIVIALLYYIPCFTKRYSSTQCRPRFLCRLTTLIILLLSFKDRAWRDLMRKQAPGCPVRRCNWQKVFDKREQGRHLLNIQIPTKWWTERLGIGGY
jgi:hypothetical protein